MTDDDQREGGRAEMARSLVELRKNAGLTQTQLGDEIGVTQYRISRAEQGQRLLKAEEVRAYAIACGATPAAAAELAALNEAVRDSHQDVRSILQRGAVSHQALVARLEETAALVRAFQPAMVLGQLQSEGYARAVMQQRPDRPAEEVERLVAQRMEKNRMLRDPGRRWELVMTEGALTWGLGSAAVMAEQVDHIAAVSRLPHVRVGIIPAYRVSGFTIRHGWHMYDSDAVQIGTVTATALIRRPDEIGDYARLFDKLLAVASFGDEARAHLARIADDYRRAAR